MPDRRALLLFAALLFAACSRPPEPAIDGQLAAEIANIKAIDNHAHPVLAGHGGAEGDAGDREFDALPVDNMEAQSDPVAPTPIRTPMNWGGRRAGGRRRPTGGKPWRAP